MLSNISDNNYRRDEGLKSFLRVLTACSAKEPCAVFIVVIDNFSMLGNAYGYSEADKIIAELCAKISGKFGSAHRVSDDSLVIIHDEVSDDKNRKTQSELKKLISKFGSTSKHESAAHISSVVNFAVVDNSNAGENIFDKLYAETANRHYKDILDGSGSKKSRAQMALANEISDALDSHRLKLAYQPVIEAKTGNLHSYECLLRIMDAEGNSSSAGSFIHIAEKMGIIENIDIHVLNLVLDKLEEDKNIRLSFNISNLTVGNAAWTAQFFQRITPQSAKRLTVEITETAVMLDLRSTAYFIAKLQEAGCRVALDDFGSGYTSFSQIRSLSLDYVKLDGSIIKGITTNHHNQLLVKSLLEFLKGLKLKTIAEFVDGGDTAKYLIDLGIDYMQGNYFGEAKLGT